MKKNSVEGVAKLLRVLVYIVLGCNVICLPLVPYFVLMSIFIQSLKVLTVPYAMAMIAFFWVCGVCTAVILWNPSTIFTYNTLFIPCFFMAGLLFRVMAALFRQAALLQEDQDLTI